MTVKELIERLSKFDGDKEVSFFSCNGDKITDAQEYDDHVCLH